MIFILPYTSIIIDTSTSRNLRKPWQTFEQTMINKQTLHTSLKVIYRCRQNKYRIIVLGFVKRISLFTFWSQQGTINPSQWNIKIYQEYVSYQWYIITNVFFTLQAGRTRTKDKYRIVYSDHQRLELEKEFHYSRYITIRRKAELANSVGLSERQVNILNQSLYLDCKITAFYIYIYIYELY